MQIKDWEKRWENNRIGFHKQHENHYLTAHIHRFKLKSDATIFIPLCGKSVDIFWLAQLGFNVIGVECSELAVKAFFNEHQLDYTLEKASHLNKYTHQNICLYQGDFFDLSQEHVNHCDFIYDRASLIALPEEIRPQYVSHLKGWFSNNTQMLLVSLSYDPSQMSGPPFSVTQKEIEQFYQMHKIQILEQNDVINESPKSKNSGLDSLIETAFHIS